jgi:predicted PurR-regulated permease PerM
VPAAFAALTVSPWRAILTILLFVLVQQLDNNFISPKIIEGKLGVHPVVSIIVLFIGGELWGLFGILLGIPLYAIIRYIVRFFLERRIKKCAKP